jgi:hypothetical protein
VPHISAAPDDLLSALDKIFVADAEHCNKKRLINFAKERPKKGFIQPAGKEDASFPFRYA